MLADVGKARIVLQGQWFDHRVFLPSLQVKRIKPKAKAA